MKISTKGRYALRIMADLALNEDGSFIPLKEIAVRQGLTVKYLEQITARLNHAGMLKSLRGNMGGYKLAKAPCEYTVGDILRTTEGSLAPVACVENGRVNCARKGACLTAPVWAGLARAVSGYLDAVTLEDVVRGRV